jgi:hypothetical protein
MLACLYFNPLHLLRKQLTDLIVSKMKPAHERSFKVHMSPRWDDNYRDDYNF